MSEPLLELRGVNKSFGAVHVLHDVDFAVYPGAGDRPRRRQRRRQVHAGQEHRRHLPHRHRRVPLRGQAGRRPRPPRRRRRSASRSSTRTSRCATTSTSSRTCSSAARAQARHRARRGHDGDARPARPSRRCRCAPSSRCASPSPASPVASGRPWPSPRRCCGTPRSCCSTSRPPRSAWPRPARSSTWCAGWPTSGLGVVLISPQHDRRVRGRRPDHRALPRPGGRRGPDQGRHPQPDRRADHRRPLRRPRHLREPRRPRVV